MTARAEAEKAITAVLAEHRHLVNDCSCGYAIKTPSQGDPNVFYLSLPSEAYRAHVASVLNDLMADAWDEGAKTLDEFHHHRRKVPGPMPPPNPYRVTDTEAAEPDPCDACGHLHAPVDKCAWCDCGELARLRADREILNELTALADVWHEYAERPDMADSLTYRAASDWIMHVLAGNSHDSLRGRGDCG